MLRVHHCSDQGLLLLIVSALKANLLVCCGVGHCLSAMEGCLKQGLLMQLRFLLPQSSLQHSAMSLLTTSQHGNDVFTQGDEPSYLVLLCHLFGSCLNILP